MLNFGGGVTLVISGCTSGFWILSIQTKGGHIFLNRIVFSLPETNIAPENGWLEDYFPFGMAHFQVLC